MIAIYRPRAFSITEEEAQRDMPAIHIAPATMFLLSLHPRLRDSLP
jgi:hypothetical protein